MIPRRGPRLPVLSPGRIFAFGDPHRRQECFLTEVSADGLQVRTNFAMPIDEVVGMELETHLVLVDVRSCQLRHGKFWIGLERLYAMPLTAVDALTADTCAGTTDQDAKQVAKLLALLESFLQQPASNPSRRIMSQTRAAYGKLLTSATQVACSEKPMAAATEPTLAVTVEDQAATAPVEEQGLVSVSPITIHAEAIPELRDAAIEDFESQFAAAELKALSDQPEPMAEVVHMGSIPEVIDAGTAVASEAPEPAAHVPFFYSVPVDLTVKRRAPQSAPPADWIYHFVPSPKAPLVPDLNYAAKGLIEALHAAA